MIYRIKIGSQICLLFIVLFSFSSCFSNKHLLYFPTLKDTILTIVDRDFTPKIQKGDILLIAVNSPDPQSTSLFTSGNSLTSGGVSGNATPGFLVERDGTISFPKLGVLKAAGKSKKTLSIELQDSLRNYLKDPIVNIRFINYRVTVLGEVNHPGIITSTNDRMNLLEALGQSGDLTVYANRENILVFRDSADLTITHRIRLIDNSIFSSPYFYLQSNDVIYVEPLKQKGWASSQGVILVPLIGSILTTTLALLYFFKR